MSSLILSEFTLEGCLSLMFYRLNFEVGLLLSMFIYFKLFIATFGLLLTIEGGMTFMLILGLFIFFKLTLFA